MKKVIFFALMMNFVGCQDNSDADSGKPLGLGQTELKQREDLAL